MMTIVLQASQLIIFLGGDVLKISFCEVLVDTSVLPKICASSLSSPGWKFENTLTLCGQGSK